MSMSEEEAIKILENFKNGHLERDKLERDGRCGGWKIGDIYKHLELNEAIKTLITEIEKKDKIIEEIKHYAQQKIDFVTEDIKDYIDDDREANKEIICKLREEREHWRDILRIMNNEKTYIES